jgi:hypothetical protein
MSRVRILYKRRFFKFNYKTVSRVPTQKEKKIPDLFQTHFLISNALGPHVPPKIKGKK